MTNEKEVESRRRFLKIAAGSAAAAVIGAACRASPALRTFRR